MPSEQGHQITPTFGLFSDAEVGQDPMQSLLGKAKPVVNLKAAAVELPNLV
ncbi:hypothetical protein H6F95_23775 [Cyanobacteria bacterium FACHB-471]|nr:hypothetical protein [Cyanobacteria bacterium FACHB-471]